MVQMGTGKPKRCDFANFPVISSHFLANCLMIIYSSWVFILLYISIFFEGGGEKLDIPLQRYVRILI